MLPSERYRRPDAGAVLGTLHTIMERNGYLPEDELRQAAVKLGLPLSQLYGAASFYGSFSFTPCGRHTIHVCLGTACYVRGGQRVLDALADTLNVEPGETTADGSFTLQVVRCAGSCSMSPVMEVDGRVYGRLKPNRALRLIQLDKERAGGESAL